MNNMKNLMMAALIAASVAGCKKEGCPVAFSGELEVVDRPIRGRLIDCQGKMLAMSLPLHVYHLDSKSIKCKKEVAARIIADALQLQFEDVLAKCNDQNRRYIYLAASSSDVVHETLRDRGFGIMVETLSYRKYADADLAPLLGDDFRGDDGRSGFEGLYNDLLKGVAATNRTVVNARGQWVQKFRENWMTNGNDVVLSIDSGVQEKALDALRWSMSSNVADRGWAIVLDAKSLAVRALADTNMRDVTNGVGYAVLADPSWKVAPRWVERVLADGEVVAEYGDNVVRAGVETDSVKTLRQLLEQAVGNMRGGADVAVQSVSNAATRLVIGVAFTSLGDKNPNAALATRRAVRVAAEIEDVLNERSASK